MKRVSKFAGLCLFALVATGCGKGPVATVTMSETIEPKKPLPAEHMHIAVYNAKVEGTGEFDQDKWAGMAADMIQYELEQAAERHGVPIKLVDREHMKVAMAESDMASAGITEDTSGTAGSALQGATSIITSKVTIKIDKQKDEATSINAMSVIGGRWFGGGSVSSTKLETESRNITVACQFQLKAMGTNEVLAFHNGHPSQHFDPAKRPSPVFGRSKTEASMTPRDQVIGQKIEDQIKEFMCKFVPTDIETVCRVEAARSDMSKAGVKALIMDDYEGALAKFKVAVAEKDTDVKSLFGAGVACEALGRYDEALKYYKLASAYEDEEPQYPAAVKRVKNRQSGRVAMESESRS
ncbi:MAG: tetratricopeptide repeat protein [Phycisphaerae bacterium]